MITTKEKMQTIRYYRKNLNLFETLTLEQRDTLKNNLSDCYDAIFDDNLFNVLKVKHNSNVRNINPSNSDWVDYKNKVKELTKLADLSGLDNYGKPIATNRKQFYSMEYYSIDHKVSIFKGFKHNIPFDLIGDISNLRIIPSRENTIKNVRCFFDEHNGHLKQYFE